MGYLGVFDFIAIGFYLLTMLFIGWWYSRQQSTEEYFVAKRNANPFVVGISLMATLLSTISYLAMPGEFIKNGPGLMWSMLHGPITFLVVGYLIIPRIMRYKVVSAYELLEARFGMTIRKTASLLFILSRLSWMSFIIFTCSFAVTEITQIPMFYVLMSIGIFTTIYTVMGGIKAVLLTDVVQFSLLFLGAVFSIAYITYRCGGFSWWPDWHSPNIAALEWPKVEILSFNPFERITAFSAIFTISLWWICAASSDQVAIQRYLCTRDTRSARRSLLHCLFADVSVSVIIWLVGFALLGFFLRFPELLPTGVKSVSQEADRIFPYFIGEILPRGLAGILVAALFGAAMSSLSSGISSIGTVLLTDFKTVFGKGCLDDDKKLLKRSKLTGMLVGLSSTFLSYAIFIIPGNNLLEIDYRIGLYFGVPLFATFMLAFFVSFSTPAGAWAAIIAGFLAGVFFSFWQQIVGIFTETQDFSIILIMPSAIVCSITAGVLVSSFTKPRVDPKLQILKGERR